MSRAYFFEPTREQESVITGSLLGDAHLDRLTETRKHSTLQKNQTSAHLEYLEWHTDIFGDAVRSLKRGSTVADGKRYGRWTLRLKAGPYWNEMRAKWYPSGIKVLPKDIKLDPLAIGIWFCDDGNNDVSARSASFATYNFTQEECEQLQSLLLPFGIHTRVNGGVLHVKAESYKTFIELVRPFIPWDCFKHKVAYRDSEVVRVSSDEMATMMKLCETGLGVTEIAKITGRSRSVVSRRLRDELGLTACPRIKQCHSGLPLNNTSGVKYVGWDKERGVWKAQKTVNGKNKVLGRFKDLESAKIAVISAGWWMPREENNGHREDQDSRSS